MSGPIITYLIIGITCLVSYKAFSDQVLKEKLLHFPYLVKLDKEYYRLISHGFVHANTTHLLLNMLVLFMFGSHIERFLVGTYGNFNGKAMYLAFYIGALLFATIPSMRKHSDNSYYRSLGASGAVSAVMIAYMVLYPGSRIAFFFIPMPAYIGVILFFAFEIYMHKKGKSFIAHDAHIWGAIFGALFLLVLDYHYVTYFFMFLGSKIGLL